MIQEKTLFEKIAQNEVPNWKIWEDDQYMAFLTPYPNTLGATVVAPKKNIGADAFEIDEEDYRNLLKVARKIAQGLKHAFHVSRVGLVIEGELVPHVHVKLYPFHAKSEKDLQIDRPQPQFFPYYPGFITTIDGPKMEEEKLKEIAQHIQQVFDSEN
ncbi:MAG TPA: HIT family protein [Candidatus Woesebacteria bacterium]|nr:HIT family protein [Candidatus Woesebacteria bacterium]